VRLFARTLIGLATGADSAIATAYIAGYAPKNRRGSLAMLQQWTMIVGILVAYIVALIIFSAFPGGAASTGWRLVLGLGAIPALMGLGLHTQMPQSPRDSLARPLRRDAQGHGHPRHEGCQRRRHAAARHVGNGAGLTLANSGIGQSVIALAQAGRHHHVLTTTLASYTREVAAKRVPRSTPTWWSPSARTWATRLPRHTASHHRTQAV
jgi:MFS family permease